MDERSSVLRLLGLLWRTEVTDDLLASLLSGDLGEAFQAVGGLLPDPGPDSINELAIDYCQLLVGPKGHLSPYQSVWQNGKLCGDAFDSMNQFIDLAEYDPQYLPDGLFVDHLGVQLDVMAHLVDWSCNCLPEQRETVSEILSTYAMLHLRWPDQFLESARTKANTDFYGSLAKLTQEFLVQEHHFISGISTSLD